MISNLLISESLLAYLREQSVFFFFSFFFFQIWQLFKDVQASNPRNFPGSTLVAKRPEVAKFEEHCARNLCALHRKFGEKRSRVP